MSRRKRAWLRTRLATGPKILSEPRILSSNKPYPPSPSSSRTVPLATRRSPGLSSMGISAVPVSRTNVQASTPNKTAKSCVITSTNSENPSTSSKTRMAEWMRDWLFILSRAFSTNSRWRAKTFFFSVRRRSTMACWKSAMLAFSPCCPGAFKWLRIRGWRIKKSGCAFK